MFVLNFQKLSENELKKDTNFRLAAQYLANTNKDLGSADLIGAAQKPLSLGYIYHIFFRLVNSTIVEAEVYIEVYSLKITLKSLVNLDFNTNLIGLSQSDSSVTKVLAFLQKQIKLETNYVVESVEAKDYVFGRLFVVTIN